MKKAVYPQRSCRQPVTDGLTDHSCEVVEWHPGPCASLSDRASVRRRDAWEAAHPGWETLSTFDDPFRDVKP